VSATDRPPVPGLGVQPPTPGLARLPRRVGDVEALLEDLARRVEQHDDGQGPLAARWDVRADPLAGRLLRLWTYVAETVAAYAELTAGEAYLATAQDWTDLRRLAELVGYRPRPRVAASGWVRMVVDRGAEPLVPRGTAVQAPAAAGRPAQTFETVEDTQLHADWESLRVSRPLAPAAPAGPVLRLAADPGWHAGERVLFTASAGVPRGIAVVERTGEEDGTTVVVFDRSLASLVPAATGLTARAVRAQVAPARRLDAVLRVPDSGAPSTVAVPYGAAPAAVESDKVVLDRLLPDLSAGQEVVLVDWPNKRSETRSLTGAEPVEWAVAPGTTNRVTRLSFAAVSWLTSGVRPTVLVTGPAVPANHRALSPSGTGAARLRLFPRPAEAPRRIAAATGPAGGWEVLRCSPSDGDDAGGLLVDVVAGGPTALTGTADATGNVVEVRHGRSASTALGDGDAAVAGQQMAVPDAPVAHEVDDHGAVVSSLAVRVDGRAWQPRETLHGAGPDDPVYATRLAADGGVEVVFGDGVAGARPATGTGNVTAAYRVGGGLAGEVGDGEITSLLASVRGVTKVVGVGPLSGGAEQDDERRLRAVVPARARSLDRVVSLTDLADVALAYPGVSHAVAWRGSPVPGCGCRADGVHVAFLRHGPDGVRPPTSAERTALAGHLDGRRDRAVGVCVVGGQVAPVKVSAVLAADPARDGTAVGRAARELLLDDDGPLGARNRQLGVPLDRSDVLVVLHRVPGVEGVLSLDVVQVTATRWTLVAPSPAATVEVRPS
jgi:hypothetical protein